ESNIEAIAAEGITLGCNPPENSLFCPADSVTRGAMAAFIARALGLPAGDGDHFNDDGASTFEDAINRVAATGITQGCNPPENTRFCPGRTMTRGEMAAFLVRAFDLPASTTDYFGDDRGHIFEDAINRLGAAGITMGCNPPENTNFCPDDPIRRDQMATFLVRAAS
ncbi:MAG: S-layer homology domain-containing protein, partial [Acidimicrobiia bacterium]